jgi:phosphoribosylanthranilate isomerase
VTPPATAAPRVKVCCISSHEEARRAIAAGASALGLVTTMPSGPGVIDETLVASIAAAVAVDTFLLTCATRAADVVAQHARCRTTTVQLCDAVDDLAALRRALPTTTLVQVVHVQDAVAVEEARVAAAHVDAILLDSGRPNAAVKELGGTGRVHDWDVSAAVRAAIAPVPLWLAGGLTAENVGDAIRRVRPHGVDVCSGVRANGALDDARLAAFVAAVRGAA